MKPDVILQGDALERLGELPDASVQCCVTSPPYFGLRDYGVVGQIGLEATPEAWCERLVAVFHEVRRVLREDGTLWLNVGDSYANDGRWGGSSGGLMAKGLHGKTGVGRGRRHTGLKPKDLIGTPWMLALALRADGWYLRSDIIWHKPNAMPESVTDRPTRAHEYLFLLSKSARYYYDAAAIREPMKQSSLQRLAQPTFDQQQGGPKDPKAGNRSHRRALTNLRDKQRGHSRRHAGFNDRWDAMSKDEQQAMGANKRSVWTIDTAPFAEAHFATFPPALVEPCILAGSRVGDVVLDPFLGSGTVAMVARRYGRRYVGIELSANYAEMAERRVASVEQPALLYSPLVTRVD